MENEKKEENHFILNIRENHGITGFLPKYRIFFYYFYFFSIFLANKKWKDQKSLCSFSETILVDKMRRKILSPRSLASKRSLPAQTFSGWNDPGICGKITSN